MDRYAVTLDACNTREDFPSARVTLTVPGWDADDAVKRIGTVYVSKDGETINNTGNLGEGAYWYPEWSVVDVALAHADYPHWPGRLYDCPACESQCFCKPGETDCVYCAIQAEQH